MLLKLSGWFRVRAPNSAIKYVEAVRLSLVSAIQEEQTSTIHQSYTCITFRRGYNLWPYSAKLLALFDPGKISLRADNDCIVVRYDLGLRPLYGVSVFVAVLTTYLLFFYPKPQTTVLLVIFAIIGTVSGSTFYNMWRVHKWLKSAALSAVTKTLPTDSSAK